MSGDGATPGPTGAAPRPSGRLIAVLVLGIGLVAAAGYWYTRPGAAGAGPDADTRAAEASGAGAAPGPAQDADEQRQLQALAQELGERVKAQPDDAEAWTMLGRAQVAMNRASEAVVAFERAGALRPANADQLVDHANALALRNGSRIGADAAALIERALELDPTHVKGLAMGGSAALTQRKPALAVQRWERLAAVLPPGHELQAPLRESIAAVRAQLAGAGGAATPASAGAASAAAASPATLAAAGSVSGRVTLAGALVGKADPQDTLFVVARAENGSRMPLAILRKQVKDLPLDYTLDDSLAMAPQARLSLAQRVVISARISKSGQAAPAAGDLAGESAPVAVGARGVAIEITRVVGP